MSQKPRRMGRPISDAENLAESNAARLSCERRARRLLADLPHAFVEGEGMISTNASIDLRRVIEALQPREPS